MEFVSKGVPPRVLLWEREERQHGKALANESDGLDRVRNASADCFVGRHLHAAAYEERLDGHQS